MLHIFVHQKNLDFVILLLLKLHYFLPDLPPFFILFNFSSINLSTSFSFTNSIGFHKLIYFSKTLISFFFAKKSTSFKKPFKVCFKLNKSSLRPFISVLIISISL